MKIIVHILLVAVVLSSPIATMSQVGTPAHANQTNTVWEGEGVGTPQNVAHRGVQGKTGQDGVGKPYQVHSTEVVTVTVETPQGPQGQKGDQGKTGLNGAKGDKGDPGLNGTNGTDGLPGSDGPKGEPGAKGVDGLSIRGYRGQRGPRGFTGRNGRDAVVRHKVVYNEKRWNEYINRENAQDGRITMLSNRINNVAKTAKSDDNKLRNDFDQKLTSKFKQDRSWRNAANLFGFLIFLAAALVLLLLALRPRKGG